MITDFKKFAEKNKYNVKNRMGNRMVEQFDDSGPVRKDGLNFKKKVTVKRD